MLFIEFDAATNKLLFEIYDQAMVELSRDPNLSLSTIAECQNVVVRRLNELAASGERDRSVLQSAAMAVVLNRTPPTSYHGEQPSCFTSISATVSASKGD